MQAGEKIGEVADKIASLSQALSDIADASEKFKKIAGVIGAIGSSVAVLGAVAGLVTLFVPDPTMEKLNSISD